MELGLISWIVDFYVPQQLLQLVIADGNQRVYLPEAGQGCRAVSSLSGFQSRQCPIKATKDGFPKRSGAHREGYNAQLVTLGHYLIDCQSIIVKALHFGIADNLSGIGRQRQGLIQPSLGGVSRTIQTPRGAQENYGKDAEKREGEKPAILDSHRKTPFGATQPDGIHRRGCPYLTTALPFCQVGRL